MTIPPRCDRKCSTWQSCSAKTPPTTRKRTSDLGCDRHCPSLVSLVLKGRKPQEHGLEREPSLREISPIGRDGLAGSRKDTPGNRVGNHRVSGATNPEGALASASASSGFLLDYVVLLATRENYSSLAKTNRRSGLRSCTRRGIVLEPERGNPNRDRSNATGASRGPSISGVPNRQREGAGGKPNRTAR